MRINDRVLAPTDPSVEALTRLYETVTRGKASQRVHVTLDVTMPLGVGLGGSAAMAVAIAKAIAELDKTRLPLPDLLAAAAAWERVFHGNPSGVDAAAAALGGCLRFNRHTGATPLVLRSPLYLALAVASPPSLTKEMVARVAAHREARSGSLRDHARRDSSHRRASRTLPALWHARSPRRSIIRKITGTCAHGTCQQ